MTVLIFWQFFSFAGTQKGEILVFEVPPKGTSVSVITTLQGW